MSTTLTARQALERAARPQAALERKPAGDLTAPKILLRGKELSGDITDVMTDPPRLERTIAGASTLTMTVSDTSRAIVRSGLAAERSVITLDTLSFELARVSKQGSRLSLTFEDEEVAILRRQRKPLKARRGPKMTRAQFVQRLVAEPKRKRIGFFCPELTVRQPVEASKAEAGVRIEPYEFTRGQPGQPEDSWTAMQRLAEEVGWRCFMVAGVCWFISDKALMALGPAMVISEDTAGIDDIDFDHDVGLPTAEARLTCQAERWAAPPGSVVEVTKLGPANGRWLVSDIGRYLSSVMTDITLTRRQPTLPEPASSSASSASGEQGLVDGVPVSIAQAYARAETINGFHGGYVRGGGHGGFGNGPYDCSGGVSDVLHAGGMLSTPMATGALMGWGQAGQGRYMTVWVKDTPGSPFSGSHTFIEFAVGRQRWFEAGGTRGAPTGWRSSKSTAGFTARHWPGT